MCQTWTLEQVKDTTMIIYHIEVASPLFDINTSYGSNNKYSKSLNQIYQTIG